MIYRDKKIYFGKALSVHFDSGVEINGENEIYTENRTRILSSENVTAKLNLPLGMTAQKIKYSFMPVEPVMLNEFSIKLDYYADDSSMWDKAKNDFHWIPNIKKKPHHIAGEHVFRSPAVIIAAGGCVLIPDIHDIVKNGLQRRFLDLRFHSGNAPVIEYGVASNSPDGHVYFKKDEMTFEVGTSGVYFSFYLLSFENCDSTFILQECASFIWKSFAAEFMRSPLPQTVAFDKYAEYGYGMALKYLWQDVSNDSGGITLSTFVRDDGVIRGREYADDLWFHAWFNNMRTAYGLAMYGYRDEALKIARLLISAPLERGFFPTIYAPHEQQPWVRSSRDHGGDTGLYSLVDCAWAALWLRRFIEEQEFVEGAEMFLDIFSDSLLSVQNKNGSFPCWLYANGLKNDSRLNTSASSAMHAWFLGEEYIYAAKKGIEKHEKYQKMKNAVERAAEFIISEIIPKQKFEDFELYYSCSKKPLDFYDEITCMYGQNTLSIQWCAECLRTAYIITQDKNYLKNGVFCVNLLCMYQQVWDYPRLDFYTFGGFGVMNTDGEWNDARQAQFAETLMNYYEHTGKFEYIERAAAAAKAAFALMIINENKSVCPRNYENEDNNSWRHGSSAENYGHGGNNVRSGQSGFHWGVGSALTTAAILRERYGDIFIDLRNKMAVGLNGAAILDFQTSENHADMKITTIEGIDNFKVKIAFINTNDFTLNIENFTVHHGTGDVYYAKRI